MKTLSDFEFNKFSLSDGIIFVSKIIRRDFPVDKVNEHLNYLVSKAEKVISQENNVEKKVFLLLELFYKKWVFKVINGVYSLSEAIWLDNVLFQKKGAPISLGAIFLHLANRLNLPVDPIIFLTHLILSVNLSNERNLYINPMNGEILTEQILDLWIKGTISPFANLTKKDIEATEHKVIIRKIFDTIKVALMEEKKMEQALKVCETLLIFNPNDPYEIRDRGLIFAHLECNHVAISDLNYFINQCPEDPISEVIKMQIYSIKRREIILH